LVVGGGPDDAGIYRMDDDRLMIQSVDFFTPIVDDPSDYGRIAAANSMSDIFAMGARPRSALNITGVPLEEVGIERLKSILSASQSTVKEAGAVVLGGHTVKSPEPIFGLAVTGFSEEVDLVQNARADAGDHLILTKPLGTGILTTAHKNQEIPVPDWLESGVRWMSRLNKVGVELAREGLVSSMTDITGYGFLGHCFEMLNDRQGIEITFDSIPVLDGIPQLVEAGQVPGGTRSNWESVQERTQLNVDGEIPKWILSDAQTSGGLLLAVPHEHRKTVIERLEERDLCSSVIGHITQTPGALVNP